jgi:isopentenyldiphosphate isomerase
MKEVITCFPSYRGQILLLKRSDEVETYPGKWGTVTGFLEHDSVEEQCIRELVDELGIEEEHVMNIERGESFVFSDDDMEWKVNPLVAHLDIEDDFRLNFENEDYMWIDPADITLYDTVPRLDSSMKRALKMRFTL